MKNKIGLISLIMALCIVLNSTSTLAVQTGSEKGNKKCTDGIDNDGDGLIDGDDPDCGGGGGGDPEFMGDLDVRWNTAQSFPSFFETDTRPCTWATEFNYHCLHVNAPAVIYNLPAIGTLPTVTQTARNGNETLCGAFEGGQLINPNSIYNFEWDCPGGGASCRIRILNWTHPDLGGVGSPHGIAGVGAMIIEAFADTNGGHTNTNPFADAPMTLSPDLVAVTFKAVGKNKTIAKCEYTGAAVQGITFDIAPSP